MLHELNLRMSGSYYFALVGGGDRPLLELEFNHKKEKDQRTVFSVFEKVHREIYNVVSALIYMINIL